MVYMYDIVSVTDHFFVHCACIRWSACEVQSGSRPDPGGVSEPPAEVHVRARQKDKDHSKTVHQVSHCEFIAVLQNILQNNYYESS